MANPSKLKNKVGLVPFPFKGYSLKNNEKTLFEVILFATFVCVFLTSCDGDLSQDLSTSTTPEPPSILEQLPQSAEMRCEENQQYNNNPLSLWQYAARTPQDTSNSNPDRGSKTGSVMFCTQITVLGYEWSTFDEAFW